jgi:hypothetical protein
LAKKSKPVTLVVRRGALRRFDRLKQATRELPAEVIWDRRGKEEKESGSSSGDVSEPPSNRRKTTPSTWDLADFVLSEDGSSSPSDTDSKKS